MPLLILLIVIGLEAWVVYLVGEAVDSLGLAIWVAIGTCILGGSLLSRARAGLDPQKVQQRLLMGGNPGKAIESLIAPFAGAVLLLFPGFITDAIGLLVLFPPTRSLFSVVLKRLVMKALQKPMQAQMRQQGMGNPEDLQRMMEQMFQGGGMPGAPRGPMPGNPGDPGPAGDGEQVKDADFRVID